MQAQSEKKLKDPIYGYIAIPRDIIKNIIDTAPFQRLRRIIQTSYAPVFASAVHNRFVHSLGVYHLGRMAGETIKKAIEDKISEYHLDSIETGKLNGILDIFLLACLLHDVGHAPFSHTGEGFFVTSEFGKDIKPLHNKLKEYVEKPSSFNIDIPQNISDAAAPHEIVSAIVGIKEFGVKEFEVKANKKQNPFYQLFQEEKEFFARCITGYLYSELTLENSIRNCFIQLLNSKLIDVDKLDYLIRDAYITGFDSTRIDYQRLLSSLTVTFKDNVFNIAYRKGAVSVIENVVYAHDSERKWIQTHPVILYENYLLNHIFKALGKEYNIETNKLFSLETLSEKGVIYNENLSLRLLSDDDIIHLMKVHYNKPLIKEYFQRTERRHPIWKSEAEYRRFFEKKAGTDGDIFNSLRQTLNAIVNCLNRYTDTGIINKQLIQKLEDELNAVKNSPEKLDLDSESSTIQIKEKQCFLKAIQCLEHEKIFNWEEEDCVILKADQFSSGFWKFILKDVPYEIRIVLDNDTPDESVSFNELVVSLDSRKKSCTDLFYMYSHANKSVSSIANALIKNSI